jgi:hypothetical protein
MCVYVRGGVVFRGESGVRGFGVGDFGDSLIVSGMCVSDGTETQSRRYNPDLLALFCSLHSVGRLSAMLFPLVLTSATSVGLKVFVSSGVFGGRPSAFPVSLVVFVRSRA